MSFPPRPEVRVFAQYVLNDRLLKNANVPSTPYASFDPIPFCATERRVAKTPMLLSPEHVASQTQHGKVGAAVADVLTVGAVSFVPMSTAPMVKRPTHPVRRPPV